METINFTKEALSDLAYWKRSGNVVILKRIRQLLQAVELSPHSGIGKPEALRHDLSGLWSRRINQEHRLIYKINEDSITVISLRYHYTK